MIRASDVMEKWIEVKDDDEKILFIVGAPGAGKSAVLRELSENEGWQYIEAKELLNEAIIETPREERPEKAHEILLNEINRRNADVIIVDSIEILFAPILNLNPVELLKTLSHKKPIVVGWRGSLEGDNLYLEHNNNPKYYKHDVKNVNHVVVLE